MEKVMNAVALGALAAAMEGDRLERLDHVSKREARIRPEQLTVDHKKIARGRGNQGDWAQNSRQAVGTLEHHKDHNAEVDRRKAEKRARQAKRKLYAS